MVKTNSEGSTAVPWRVANGIVAVLCGVVLALALVLGTGPSIGLRLDDGQLPFYLEALALVIGGALAVVLARGRAWLLQALLTLAVVTLPACLFIGDPGTNEAFFYFIVPLNLLLPLAALIVGIGLLSRLKN
ncbi:hypothetical protein [Lacticaseibacillus kribbianus]|uniref:hypothetical protein n=1 Tax=Lacticaseibacillus kribbianus TaxID=2926292 RepID=UPI001CD1A9C7|nr:hypothetical protein [Lacticaseibacillus kribbianus]